MNGSMSINSLWVCLLLMYRMATDFYKVILYWTILLKQLIPSRSFLVEYLWSLMYNIISSAHRDNLTSSFSIYNPLVYISYLIVLSSASSLVLKRSGDSGHPCLLPGFNRIVLSLSLYNAGCGFVMYSLDYGGLCSFHFYFLQYILSWKHVRFCQRPFQHIWDNHLVLSLSPFIGCITFIYYVESPLQPWDKANLIMVDDFLKVQVLVIRCEFT